MTKEDPRSLEDFKVEVARSRIRYLIDAYEFKRKLLNAKSTEKTAKINGESTYNTYWPMLL